MLLNFLIFRKMAQFGPILDVTANFLSNFLKAFYKAYGALSVRFDSPAARSWKAANQPTPLDRFFPTNWSRCLSRIEGNDLVISYSSPVQKMRWDNCIQGSEKFFFKDLASKSSDQMAWWCCPWRWQFSELPFARKR